MSYPELAEDLIDKDDNLKGDAVLVGVSLLSDGSRDYMSSLGAVVVTAAERIHLTLPQLRHRITEQIILCPPSFRFCSSQRWPISASQEKDLKLRSLMSADRTVFIQQTYDKPKIGIKSKEGTPLGFIFSDPKQTLSDMRFVLNKEIPFFSKIHSNCQFLDGNGWPVSKPMEDHTQVSEVLVSSCVVVCTDLSCTVEEVDVDGSTSLKEPPKKRQKRMKQTATCKDFGRQWSSNSSIHLTCSPSLPVAASVDTNGSISHLFQDKTKKQLLISYVRAEAADYALHLKNKLAELGHSVYLDVHEIKIGVDWQDSLNFAVSNCEIFIPLVTPRYGETQWTNREVKLADVLGKYILPVSFLTDWPPRCLAIQFATTQYILCGRQQPQLKAHTNMQGKGNCCMLSWDIEDVEVTAAEISQRLKFLSGSTEPLFSAPKLARMETLRRTFMGKLPWLSRSLSEDISPTTALPLVVVCLHPAESDFGQEIKSWLGSVSYMVWLSCELDFPGDDPETQSLTLSQHADGEGTKLLEDQLRRFQDVADRAAVILVILSEKFAKSHTCKQQLFYCEQRKPIIPIHYQEFSMPSWLSMLIGPTSSEGVHQHNYHQTLQSHIQRMLCPAAKQSLEQWSKEAKINHLVEHIRQTISTNSCVYVAGSTSFCDPRTEEICRSVGKNLAYVDNICIATGGFAGVGETVSRAFHEEVQHLLQRRDVWHILPDRDPKDWTKQAKQNVDGTFAVSNFGKTLFCGDSVRQRESVVGRCFEVCIFIEAGGPGAPQEAEEFVWNDRLVIPLICTGATAGGEFSAPHKMFKVPQGVSPSDWEYLYNTDISADAVGQCVARIVSGILKHLASCKGLNPTLPSIPCTPAFSTSYPKDGAGCSSRSLKTSPSPAKSKPSLSTMKTLLLG